MCQYWFINCDNCTWLKSSKRDTGCGVHGDSTVVTILKKKKPLWLPRGDETGGAPWKWAGRPLSLPCRREGLTSGESDIGG